MPCTGWMTHFWKAYVPQFMIGDNICWKMGFVGGPAVVTLPAPPPFFIMTGGQLTFLHIIWDQIALFHPAISLRYVFNPVKQLYRVHGYPGIALHHLQQL